jgi:DNA-damage-inducible protein D
MSELNAVQYESFESIKHTDGFGCEYWLTREFVPVLEYVQWRNFARVLERAILSCKNSGTQCSKRVYRNGDRVEMPVKPRKNNETKSKIGFAEVSKT